MPDLEGLLKAIDALPLPDQRKVLRHLLTLLPSHPMETRLMTTAETLLEAIGRASPLTIRGIEGILAEASFATEILPAIPEWSSVDPPADAAFDFLLTDRSPEPHVRLQVKMQRRRNHLPLMANETMKSTRRWPADHYVVEVQRTRGGADSKGLGTRPYRFGEFDVLAVSLGASTGHWHAFIYTLADWLLAEPGDPTQVLKYQPVPPHDTESWTMNFLTAVDWLRSGVKKKIPG